MYQNALHKTGRIIAVCTMLGSWVSVPVNTAWAEQTPAQAAPQRTPEFIDLWENITPKLEEVLERQEQHGQLPNSALFGDDKQSNRQSINQLLDEAITLLEIPSGRDYRASIRELENAIQAAEEQIRRDRQKRLSAPDDALWQKTIADYDAAIAQSQARIAKLKEKIQTLKKEFAAELQTLGLEVSAEQLDFMLSTVIGDDLIGISVAFDNVKAMTMQLEQLMVDSGEDLITARRYYGIYTVLLSSLARMHDELLSAARGYMQDIDTIVEKTLSLNRQSQALRRHDTRHQQTLRANMEAQQLTLRTAKMYRDYLLRQAGDVSASKKRLAHDLAVARNTYETVKVSGELVQLIYSSEELMQTLFSRSVPTMFTFQNLQVKREFEKLTERLRANQKR